MGHSFDTARVVDLERRHEGKLKHWRTGMFPGHQQAERPVWCREIFLKSIVQTHLLGISLTIDSKVAILQF